MKASSFDWETRLVWTLFQFSIYIFFLIIFSEFFD